VDCNYVGAILDKEFSDINVSEGLKDSFGVPITDFKTYDDDNCNIIIGSGMSFNRSTISKLSTIAKERIADKKRIEAEQEEEDDEDDSLDLSSFTKKSSTKKASPKKNNKDLSDILSRYRNIK